jgi:hypothetical protein
MTINHSADSAAEHEWIKSSYSTAAGAECVEVASATGTVYVRDSKDKQGPRLAFSPDEWSAFVAFTADFR